MSIIFPCLFAVIQPQERHRDRVVRWEFQSPSSLPLLSWKRGRISSLSVVKWRKSIRIGLNGFLSSPYERKLAWNCSALFSIVAPFFASQSPFLSHCLPFTWEGFNSILVVCLAIVQGEGSNPRLIDGLCGSFLPSTPIFPTSPHRICCRKLQTHHVWLIDISLPLILKTRLEKGRKKGNECIVSEWLFLSFHRQKHVSFLSFSTFTIFTIEESWRNHLPRESQYRD